MIDVLIETVYTVADVGGVPVILEIALNDTVKVLASYVVVVALKLYPGVLIVIGIPFVVYTPADVCTLFPINIPGSDGNTIVPEPFTTGVGDRIVEIELAEGVPSETVYTDAVGGNVPIMFDIEPTSRVKLLELYEVVIALKLDVNVAPTTLIVVPAVTNTVPGSERNVIVAEPPAVGAGVIGIVSNELTVSVFTLGVVDTIVLVI